jgi:hypothetical protein
MRSDGWFVMALPGASFGNGSAGKRHGEATSMTFGLGFQNFEVAKL